MFVRLFKHSKDVQLWLQDAISDNKHESYAAVKQIERWLGNRAKCTTICPSNIKSQKLSSVYAANKNANSHWVLCERIFRLSSDSNHVMSEMDLDYDSDDEPSSIIGKVCSNALVSDLLMILLSRLSY